VFLLFVATLAYVQYQKPSLLIQIASLAEEKQEEYGELSFKKDFKDAPQLVVADFVRQMLKLKERHLKQHYSFQFTLDVFRPPQFV